MNKQKETNMDKCRHDCSICGESKYVDLKKLTGSEDCDLT